MKAYESPLCTVDILVFEESFLTATTEDYTVVHSNPFGSMSYRGEEEDGQ